MFLLRWGNVLDSHFNSDVVILALFLLVFLTFIRIEFKFLVSIRIYHIQRIQQITSPFQVISTPVYLLPLSPPVQIILSVFFLICSCPLFLSRSGKDMILLLLVVSIE